jgi:HD-like signal output (HDOD) protein
MARSARELARETVALSSLPTIYARLVGALEKPRVSTAQIAAIIASDSALTARLLRLVNSAFYAFPSRIETVQQAVFLVGTRQIHDLALATSVLRVFAGIPPELVDMKSFWQHSIATGVTARVLATCCKEAGTERFFVAGVLHDLGRLLLFAARPADARAALLRSRTRGEPLEVAERTILGYDHSEAGGALLEAWNLHEDLQDMVRWHHAPAEARRCPRETAVLHIADVIVTAMEIGHSGDHVVPALARGAWEQLGLSPTVLGALTEQVELQVNEVAQSMLTGGG